MSLDLPTKTLNTNQHQAVVMNDGPLLIVAGAGTGKTTVIVEKIKYLITHLSAKPEEILALTFTEKAASEMEERVDVALPYGYFQMEIATFHAFADKILRAEAHHIGLNPAYTLMTQAESIMFLRKRLFVFDLKYFRPLGNPHKFIESLLQHFSRLKDEDVSPKDYLDWATGLTESSYSEEEREKYQELARAYQTYEELKMKEGYFDFSDLIFYLLTLFRTRPSVLAAYKAQFKYVLADEFQDTNIAQYSLLKLLCPPEETPHLTIVGDDSQAIYKFRGASVSNILAFMRDYPTAKQVMLNENYRSYQSILDTSYTLIQNNDPDTLEAQLGISKKLVSSRGKNGECVSFHLFDKGDEEADFIVETIQNLKAANSYTYSDFAILMRANSHAEPFVRALSYAGVPYRFLGAGMLYKQPEVKDLIAYLKFLSLIDDSPSFYRVLTMNIFQLDHQDIHLLLSFAKKTTLSLFQATLLYCSFFQSDWFLSEYEIYRHYLPLIKEDTRNSLIPIIGMVKKHLGCIKRDSAGQILYYFLEDTGLLKKLAASSTAEEEKEIKNIARFFEKLKAFEVEHEEASVEAVVDFIEMSMELGESPVANGGDVPNYDGVQLLTTHASKGLEFPVIFLVNLSKGRFPTTEKKDPIPIPPELIKEILPQGDYHLEEERRLFYVGLTRAQDRAYLTASFTYGTGKRERKISPFVQETLGIDAIKKEETPKKEEKIQLSLFEYKKKETPIPQEIVNLKTFSFSQLESFATCPLQYKYQYLLKIPSSQNAAASFGDSIHKTLQRFYTEFSEDKTIGLPRLLELYEQNWIPVGYASQAHHVKRKKEGAELLTQYLETFHHIDLDILDLEKLFKIRVRDDIFITGKIDRVDRTSENGIEIIDYKTGRRPDDRELKKSLQLSVYALAACDPGLYHKNIKDVTLTFYYLQSLEQIRMQKSAEDLEQVKDEIIEKVETLRNSTFEPKKSPACTFCPFRMICEAW
ncbi:ATP-dependent helicase [Candidatus Roizmanbacteria bacterium]|nr:ATP-dependent helicase [Candidatus Roizmanbacteria bacterium]